MRNKLDQVDFSILNILAENAQTPYTDVAKQLIVSPGTVHMRIRKMKRLVFNYWCYLKFRLC